MLAATTGLRRDFLCLVVARYNCWEVVLIQVFGKQAIKSQMLRLAKTIPVTISVLVTWVYLFPAQLTHWLVAEDAISHGVGPKMCVLALMMLANIVADVVYLVLFDMPNRAPDTSRLAFMQENLPMAIMAPVMLWVWIAIIFGLTIFAGQEHSVKVTVGVFGFALPILKAIVLKGSNILMVKMEASKGEDANAVVAAQIEAQVGGIIEIIFNLSGVMAALQLGTTSITGLILVFLPAEVIEQVTAVVGQSHVRT